MIVKRQSLIPMDFDGLKIYDYTAGQTNSSSFAEIEILPGVRHREAWSRRSDKYYYVTAGNVVFSLDGEIHGLEKGDFCLVKHGSHFWYANETDSPAALLLIHTPCFDLGEEVFVE
jgi:mannose-6-phosphate isomerase-like protein (cupin superfamily)